MMTFNSYVTAMLVYRRANTFYNIPSVFGGPQRSSSFGCQSRGRINKSGEVPESLLGPNPNMGCSLCPNMGPMAHSDAFCIGFACN